MLLLVGVILGSSQSLVEAAELNFGIKAILPDNQIDKASSFFDLRMKPGEEQTVEVEVTNVIDKEIELHTFVSAAGTNVNGVIDYPQPIAETKYDESLKYPLPTLVSLEETIKVPAKATIKVPVTIKMPSESYDGMIVGGISFYQKEEEDDQEKQTSGMGVKNKFMYRLGVKLIETDTAVEPDLKLLGVKAGQVNYRNAVMANLQNPEAEVLNGLKLEAQVFQKGSDTPIFTAGKDNMKVAPNSNFEYPVYLGKKAFKAGKYTLKLVATADNDKKWEFSKDFEITQKEAEKYNEESSVQLDYETDWIKWAIIGGVALLVVIIVIVVLVVVLKKRKKARRKATLRTKHDKKQKGQSSQSNGDGTSTKSKKKRKKSN